MDSKPQTQLRNTNHPTQKTPTRNKWDQPFETIALSKHHYKDKERLHTLHKAITHIEQHKENYGSTIPPAGEKDDPHAT